MKNSIRKEILGVRSNLTSIEINQKSKVIWKNLQDSKILDDKKIILNYADFRNEVVTADISEYAFFHQIPLFYPKVRSLEMKFYRVNNLADLEPGYQNILEPSFTDEELLFQTDDILEENIAVIIPGSVFSKKGVRYGYGKGFYDRFLNQYPDLCKIALAYSFQVLNELEKENHDVMMDFIITENEIIQLN